MKNDEMVALKRINIEKEANGVGPFHTNHSSRRRRSGKLEFSAT